MSTISSLGIGSGLDLAGIVEGLVEAERAPTEARLSVKQETITTELSAFGALRSSLSLFQSSLSSLKFTTSFSQMSAKLSDNSVFSVDVAEGAPTGSFNVEVNSLATKHSLATNASTAFNDVTETIGTGTLTIRFGSTATDPYSFTPDPTKTTQTIEISEANDNTTVEGFRNYINTNDFGVEASIINDGNGYRLVMTSKDTGASNSMEITVTNDGDADNEDNAGLSQLAFNAAAQSSATQTVAAQDANLLINGLSISRETNTVTGAIDGITLNLLKADQDNLISVEISESFAGAQSSVQEFVSGYNSLVGNIQTLTSYNAVDESAGILLGDFTVRNMSNQLRSVINNMINSSASNIRTLADMGITTESDGRLSIDSDQFEAAFSEYPEEVEALFINQGNVTDSNIEYVGASTSITAGEYSIFVDALATRGVYSGDVINSLTIDADNDEFTISVDGVESNTIILTQGLYADGDALAQHIQAQINGDVKLKDKQVGVLVAYDSASNRFDITSQSYGSDSLISLTSIDTDMENDLGLSIATGSSGSDVTGTINGLPASGNGQILTSETSLGISLKIDGGATGSRGAVSITNGIIGKIDELLDGFLDNSGALKSREDGLSDELEEIQLEREELEDRISKLEDRFVRQFSALDSLLAQFNATSSFLEQQLQSLPEPNSVNRN